MHIDAVRDTLRVQVGPRFDDAELARLEKAVVTLGPFSSLTIDFTSVRQSDDAALARLARALKVYERGEIALRGLTTHQLKLLTYLGIELDGHDVVPT